MREILRSNDVVLINFVVVLLRDAGLAPLLADEHVSSIEGSIGALPRRVLIPSDELTRAKRVMQEADLSQWISSDANR
jgi:Putative prokaryotic signal transducing protein